MIKFVGEREDDELLINKVESEPWSKLLSFHRFNRYFFGGRIEDEEEKIN